MNRLRLARPDLGAGLNFIASAPLASAKAKADPKLGSRRARFATRLLKAQTDTSQNEASQNETTARSRFLYMKHNNTGGNAHICVSHAQIPLPFLLVDFGRLICRERFFQ
jgi:hypothetical protein